MLWFVALQSEANAKSGDDLTKTVRSKRKPSLAASGWFARGEEIKAAPKIKNANNSSQLKGVTAAPKHRWKRPASMPKKPISKPPKVKPRVVAADDDQWIPPPIVNTKVTAVPRVQAPAVAAIPAQPAAPIAALAPSPTLAPAPAKKAKVLSQRNAMLRAIPKARPAAPVAEKAVIKKALKTSSQERLESLTPEDLSKVSPVDGASDLNTAGTNALSDPFAGVDLGGDSLMGGDPFTTPTLDALSVVSDKPKKGKSKLSKNNSDPEPVTVTQLIERRPATSDLFATVCACSCSAPQDITSGVGPRFLFRDPRCKFSTWEIGGMTASGCSELSGVAVCERGYFQFGSVCKPAEDPGTLDACKFKVRAPTNSDENSSVDSPGASP